MKGVFPDDPIIENIDPVQKMWMFENWLEDKSDQYELAKHLGYLIGSFINPEAVRRLTGAGAKQFKSDDKEFDELSKSIIDNNRKEDSLKPHRRRKKIIKE